MTAGERAADLKREGLNCAQAVACAFANLTPLTHDQLAATTAGLGAGVGNHKGTCGAITGAAVVIGLFHPDKKAAYPLCARVQEEFAARHGGCTLCGQLKRDGHVPCMQCVADAAGILDNILSEEKHGPQN